MRRMSLSHALVGGSIVSGLVSMASGAPPGFQSAVSASGPALWYQLNEASGNAINRGSLGASFDASVSATVQRSQSTLKGDTGMRFDDAADFLESLSSTTLTGNPTFSIEALVNLDATGGGLWGPMLHWGGSGTGTAVYFSISNFDNNRLYAGFYNSGPRTASTVPTGAWIHVVWVRQGGNDSASGTTLYINGVPVALQQDPALSPGFVPAGSINVVSTPFRINRGADNIGTRKFTGTLDEIALYTRALSASEVVQHAALSGVTCYANCDGSTGSPALSASDFVCFLSAFRAGAAYANCDGSTAAPTLTASDFVCFLGAFRAGCP